MTLVKIAFFAICYGPFFLVERPHEIEFLADSPLET